MSSKGKGFKPLMFGLLMSKEEIERRILERRAEEMRRLLALADSMGIPESPYREHMTLWELVRKYVPELKTSRPEGARSKWGEGARLVLPHLVARLMRQDGLTKAEACAHLAENDPWLSNVEGKPDGNALARQCNSKALNAALNDRMEHEQLGATNRLDTWLDEARRLMIEIAAEKSYDRVFSVPIIAP